MTNDLRALATAKVTALEKLRQAFEDGLLDQLGPFATRRFQRYRLIGMGQSFVAAQAAAARMRSLGLSAGAELATSRYGFPMDPDTLVIAVSASGKTPEVLDRLDRLDGHFPVLAITNTPGSDITKRAGVVLETHTSQMADPLSLNTFPHSALVLNSLAVVFSGGIASMVKYDQVHLIEAVSAAWRHLNDTTSTWLPAAAEVLTHPDGIVCLSPAERPGSAAHSAHVLRGGAGRSAWAFETTDYTFQSPISANSPTSAAPSALLYTGSPYERSAVDYLASHGSGVVAVGAGAASVQEYLGDARRAVQVRYPGDEDTTRLATFAEHHVATLLASALA